MLHAKIFVIRTNPFTKELISMDRSARKKITNLKQNNTVSEENIGTIASQSVDGIRKKVIMLCQKHSPDPLAVMLKPPLSGNYLTGKVIESQLNSDEIIETLFFRVGGKGLTKQEYEDFLRSGMLHSNNIEEKVRIIRKVPPASDDHSVEYYLKLHPEVKGYSFITNVKDQLEVKFHYK